MRIALFGQVSRSIFPRFTQKKRLIYTAVPTVNTPSTYKLSMAGTVVLGAALISYSLCQEEVLKKSTIRLNMPPLTPGFQGRHTALVQLSDFFLNNQGKSGPRVVQIFGMTGIGKTQLMTQFANAHTQHYDLILFIDASSEETIKSSLADLAQYPKRGHRQLVVVDNIQDQSQWADIRSKLPFTGQIDWLIAAQTPIDIDLPGIKTIALAPLSHDESTSRIRSTYNRYAPNPATPAEIDEFATRCRGIPEVIDGLIYYSEQTGFSVTLAELNAKILAHGLVEVLKQTDAATPFRTNRPYINRLKSQADGLFGTMDRDALPTIVGIVSHLQQSSIDKSKMAELIAIHAAIDVAVAKAQVDILIQSGVAKNTIDGIVFDQPGPQLQFDAYLNQHIPSEAAVIKDIQQCINSMTAKRHAHCYLPSGWIRNSSDLIPLYKKTHPGEPLPFDTPQALFGNWKKNLDRVDGFFFSDKVINEFKETMAGQDAALKASVQATILKKKTIEALKESHRDCHHAIRYLFKRGQWDAAAFIVDQLMEIVDEQYPDLQHPYVATLLNYRGMIFEHAGKYTDALREYAKAESILSQYPGYPTQEMATIQSNRHRTQELIRKSRP